MFSLLKISIIWPSDDTEIIWRYRVVRTWYLCGGCRKKSYRKTARRSPYTKWYVTTITNPAASSRFALLCGKMLQGKFFVWSPQICEIFQNQEFIVIGPVKKFGYFYDMSIELTLYSFLLGKPPSRTYLQLTASSKVWNHWPWHYCHGSSLTLLNKSYTTHDRPFPCL